MKDPKTGLTDKQERFCREYLKDLNATKAALRAGFSPKNADNICARLLKRPAVAAYIEKLKAARSKRTDIKADDVLRELSYVAFSDVRRLFDENGAISDPRKWPKSLARAVCSIEVEELYEHDGTRRINIGQKKKVKFWPKVPALEMLAKHLGMFRNEVSLGKETLEALVAASRKDDAG
jgi:phage terminase small subunit